MQSPTFNHHTRKAQSPKEGIMENVRGLNIDVLTGAVNPLTKLKDTGDDTLHVQFAQASHFDDVATRAEGRPVFVMMDYVTIIVPGDQTSIVHRPVRPSDLDRFPTQWAAFLNGKEQQVGYPLTEWPGVSRAQCDELSYFKITTVEALAGVSDSVCQKFMGINALRDKAKTWIAQRKGEEPALKLAAAVAQKDEELNALRASMAMMQEALEELKKAQEPKVKRTKRDPEEEAA
jgi:hypothetical protein